MPIIGRESTLATLGIDIGGSGIKGALVDTLKGTLVSERIRFSTPEKPKPKLVANIIVDIVNNLNYNSIIGVGFPGVVRHGITFTAANIHKDWIECEANSLVSKATGYPTFFLNDADAAGLAEMRFGIGKENKKGSVLFITVGTGIGSALFIDGILVPNLELGHLEVKGKEAEHRASDATRQIEKLSWKEWGRKFSRVLNTYEKLINPDLFIIGGGISSRYENYAKYLDISTKIMPAKLENLAGIIGAAMAAEEQRK
jgi:polyphosphate glucokinase